MHNISSKCTLQEISQPAFTWSSQDYKLSTRINCEICSKLTIKKLERRQWIRSGVFIINLGNISHIILVFLQLTLSLSWRRPISYRNQPIDLFCKSMGWFLYDIGLRRERVKQENGKWGLVKVHILLEGKMIAEKWVTSTSLTKTVETICFLVKIA